MMAASMVAILPVIILFFSLQKYFEQGIVLSGMKS
jgi:ABC-type glycerol-3-phosphate transport system permease component